MVDGSETPLGDAFFIVGEDTPRVPGLDAAVTGLALGAKASKTVAAAFGPRDEGDIIRVPGAMAPPGLEVGDTVRMGDGRPGLITAVSAAEVVVDVNHPMAGQDVTLDVEVVAHTPADKLQFFVAGLGCFWGPELHYARVPGVMSTAGTSLAIAPPHCSAHVCGTQWVMPTARRQSRRMRLCAAARRAMLR